MRYTKFLMIIVVVVSVMPERLIAQDAPIAPNYQSNDLSYWLKIVREREQKELPFALEAIRKLGPQASSAVPDLIPLLTSPFTPIQLGIDSDDTVNAKLHEIEVRSRAIDALAAIGKPAASAALPLLQWVVAARVVPSNNGNQEEFALFLDLTTLEVQYRLRVMDALEQFGETAMLAVGRQLLSTDPEERKLAVIILGTAVMPIAADLLKSGNCESQYLGLTILKDLQPLVAKSYIAYLNKMVVCGEWAIEGAKR